jgi:hypothetical protein
MNLLSRREMIALAASVPAFAQQGPKVPTLEGDPWRLFPMPDLGELKGADLSRQHIVDHGFYQTPAGKWRCWACIRGAAVGRIFYGWEGDSLDRGGWRPLGVTLRSSAEWGEAGAGTSNETLHAPYFLRIDGVENMFYDSRGVRMMRSTDGLHFERVDLGGDRRNVLYPDGGRDVMLLKVGDTYHSYLTVSTREREGYVILKTSKNLLDWTAAKIVCRGGKAGDGPVSAESPFVVALDKYFYLFRASSTEPVTFVYRSEDPAYFGVNDDRNLIAELPLKAPEVVLHSGNWYISDLADFQGLMLRRLQWL